MENILSNKIIGMAIQIHRELGPGLLEKVYKEYLFHKAVRAGYNVIKEKPVPLTYNETKLECGFRIDLLVENKLVVEVKSIEAFHEIHLAQILTYLRLGNYKLGLLINFNVMMLKQGIKRVINGNL